MRKIAVALVLCAVVLSAMVATTTASALLRPPWREFPVTGAKAGSVLVNMKTGAFKCSVCGLTPRVTYYLQYHVTGRFGAAVIGSGVANSRGQVVIAGRLDTSTLALIRKPGNFLIGPHVV